jgi:serine phosphatase RsbU (regulator of sigma subunit)/Tfp pilus assembly protein PilF
MRWFFCLLPLTIFLLTCLNAESQQPKDVDLLLEQLSKAKEDTNKVNILNDLCDLIERSDPKKALDYGEQALMLAEKLGFKRGITVSFIRTGYIYYYKGDKDKALDLFEKALALSINIKDKNLEAESLRKLGIVYDSQSDFVTSLNYYTKALKIKEQTGDKHETAMLLLNIGVIYHNMKNFSEALEYENKALKLFLEGSNKSSTANALARIGNIYCDTLNPAKDFKIAMEYYEKSLQLFTEDNHKRGIAVIYSNMAEIQIGTKEYNKALTSLLKALQMRKELGDKNGISILMLNIGRIYNNTGDYINAELYVKQSLAIAKEINFIEIVCGDYQVLSSIYAEKKDYKMAYDYLLKLKHTNDSIFNKENSRQIFEMKTKYETEKKEKEIELLNKDKEIKDIAYQEKLKKQRIILFSFVIGFIIISVFSIVLLRLYRQKKAANVLLAWQKGEIMEKNEELNQQTEEITAQRDEITQQRDNLELLNKELNHQKEEIIRQRDEIEIQRNDIEKKNIHITDSIRYAKRIQQAILPSKELIERLLPDSFIFFRPKDIVSGDFYWFDKKGENKVYFASVDCTGHGVPGALMSIHCFNLLDKALNEHHIEKPSEIVDFLDANIQRTLQQKNESNTVKDGMDIAICCIDKEKSILEYAGVYNPLYLFRNNELLEFKADRHAIGDTNRERHDGYNNHSIQLERNDVLYVFSDGFADQFGGIKNQKFMIRQFKETLLKIHLLSLAEQKLRLAEIFDAWKGSNNQIDDVLVIGVRNV